MKANNGNRGVRDFESDAHEVEPRCGNAFGRHRHPGGAVVVWNGRAGRREVEARLAHAAAVLTVLADADVLAVLRQLGERPRPAAELEALAAPGVLDRLRAAELVHADRYGVVGLTPAGREAWLSVRSLCQ